jgi:probable F420-dependent oxidoreductase
MTEPLTDLSAYVRAGRITSAADVLADAEEAERLGFRRVILSERYDLKEAGALLGGMAARTTRLGLATGALIPSSRPPILTAALGATMHSAYGPRFVLGLGRSTGPYLANTGIPPVSFQALVDYATIVKRLWAGEVVDYAGPAGEWTGLHLADTYSGPQPEIWSVNLGGPRACRAAAQPPFDGVLLAPFLTVEAVGRTVARLREECERIGRDPDSLHVCHPLVTAPGADDTEVRSQLHARMVTYLQEPGIGENYARLNEWDFEPIRRVREHPQFQTGMVNASADHNFHRKDLLGPAELVPDEWMTSTCATGTPEECAALLARYKDAGAHELCTYGSTPGQNAGLVAAWRERARVKA